MVDFLYDIRILIALSLFALFYVLTGIGYLANMQGADLPGVYGWLRKNFEHMWGILLFCVPKMGLWWLDWYVCLLYVAGLWLYLDDFYQHRRRTWDYSYTSPLHNWGWWTLRPWINKVLKISIH